MSFELVDSVKHGLLIIGYSKFTNIDLADAYCLVCICSLATCCAFIHPDALAKIL